jgi:hypothetical protein
VGVVVVGGVVVEAGGRVGVGRSEVRVPVARRVPRVNVVQVLRWTWQLRRKAGARDVRAAGVNIIPPRRVVVSAVVHVWDVAIIVMSVLKVNSEKLAHVAYCVSVSTQWIHFLAPES